MKQLDFDERMSLAVAVTAVIYIITYFIFFI